jgi:hypothetical protein
MSSYFNCSYRTLSSLTYIQGFYVNFFFQLIFHILRETNQFKFFCWETWAEIIFDPRWLPFLLAEISNGKKEKNQLEFSMKFRSQIEHQVNDHRLLRTSSFSWVDLASHQGHRLLRASSFSWVDLASHQEQSSKWKFEFSGPNQSLELIFT